MLLPSHRSANEKSEHAIPPSETFHWKQRHFQNAAMLSIAHHVPERSTSRLAIELRGRQHPISKCCWSILGMNDYARSRPAVWTPQTRTYAQGQQPRRAPSQPKATVKAVPMEPRARHHTPSWWWRTKFRAAFDELRLFLTPSDLKPTPQFPLHSQLHEANPPSRRRVRDVRDWERLLLEDADEARPQWTPGQRDVMKGACAEFRIAYGVPRKVEPAWEILRLYAQWRKGLEADGKSASPRWSARHRGQAEKMMVWNERRIAEAMARAQREAEKEEGEWALVPPAGSVQLTEDSAPRFRCHVLHTYPLLNDDTRSPHPVEPATTCPQDHWNDNVFSKFDCLAPPVSLFRPL